MALLFLSTVFKSAKAQSDTLGNRNKASDENFLNRYETYKADQNISGLIAVADRNGYPFPDKILSLQKELQLNERQSTAIHLINTELKRKTNEMNGFLITNERTLDSLFRYKRISNGSLIFFTNRYGLYQGELRNALLQACVKTEALLTPTQLKKYKQLQQY